jgi:hypothetical protein
MDFTIADESFDTAAPTIERQIMPAGTHRMVIKFAEEGPNEYKRSDDNPEGLCLKLRLSDADGKFKFVFDDLPKHLGWRAQQLAAAVGITPVDGRLSLTPDELVDQIVRVEVSHYTSKAGKTSAVVKKYLPQQADVPKAAKPRAPAAKAAAAFDSDSIPF